MELLTNNWANIALALVTFLGVLTAATETKKDDRILNIIKRILQAVIMGKSRQLGQKKKTK